MRERENGFSLIELMMVLTIFLIVSGAVFGLLNAAQVRYRAEQDFLQSFQGGRLGVDLMVRDVHNAGYPPASTYAVVPLDPMLAPPGVERLFAIGVAGVDGGGNVTTNCTVNGAGGGLPQCVVPNDWDLVVELDLDPENFNAAGVAPATGVGPWVEWVRYDLRRAGGETTSTLYRTVIPKSAGGNPTSAALQSQVPFVEQILQNPNLPVSATNFAPFIYECAPTFIIPGTVNVCRAEHILNVYIALQVQSSRPEIGTGRMRQITIRGMASRQYANRMIP